MIDAPLLVIGGGPAGLSAAVTLAEAGHGVLLVEQRDQLGGAIYRQPADPRAKQPMLGRRHRNAWERLKQRLAAGAGKVVIKYSTVFIGIDDKGNVLLDDRLAGRILLVRPRALLLAVGAIEHIDPFEGWDLPGVVSAGGAQLMLKETGRFAAGRTLVAGSGALPFAVAAQLSAAGQAPVAVLERGNPWRAPRAGVQLLANLDAALETISYASSLLAAGVRYVAGAEVETVTGQAGRLLVRTRAAGASRDYEVDNLIVSHGLRPNNIGLPAVSEVGLSSILKAGDCREVLGADAAVIDGGIAAGKMLAFLTGQTGPAGDPRGIRKARKLQSLLATLTGHDPLPISGQTILCRCEGLMRAELDALGSGRSASEMRLVGRFGMGACQGRFCRANVAALAGIEPASLEGRSQGFPRWPIRPVSIASICADEIQDGLP
jgi:NADPH-dependent 2,4-dienoyl-CoA reductase/sulfur reductase-like enzyme